MSDVAAPFISLPTATATIEHVQDVAPIFARNATLQQKRDWGRHIASG